MRNPRGPVPWLGWTGQGGRGVPENWDDAYYRERAKAWRDKAAALPADHRERAVCFELAEGYDRLATLLEQWWCIQCRSSE
jgi:hypothetical protein